MATRDAGGNRYGRPSDAEPISFGEGSKALVYTDKTCLVTDWFTAHPEDKPKEIARLQGVRDEIAAKIQSGAGPKSELQTQLNDVFRQLMSLQQ